MSFRRLPLRDPRTVARDIPGVLDILFPRLSGGLVSALNRKMFFFEGIKPVQEETIGESRLSKAMLFELSMARAESILNGRGEANWDYCLQVAAERQRRHYEVNVPDRLEQTDLVVADHAAHNLIGMLNRIRRQKPGAHLEPNPVIPGLGWIASGVGDFSLGSILIEVKHTERNFVAGDFRQILMYWLLKYADSIENNGNVWSEFLLINPRRNCGLMLDCDYLLQSASESLGRVELFELLRWIVAKDRDNR